MPYVISLEKIAPSEDDRAELVKKGVLTLKALQNEEANGWKGIRISTVNRLCEEKECEPGDLFKLISSADQGSEES